jgi:hypothetical protein
MMNAKDTLIVAAGLVAGVVLTGCGAAKYESSPAPAYAGDASPSRAAYPQSQPYGGGVGAAPQPGAPSLKSEEYGGDSEAAPSTMPQERPGLATSWGESRQSRVTTSPFVRGDRLNPFAVGKLFYNDPQGIQAMTDSYGGSLVQSRRFAVGVGHVDISLRDEGGNFLTGFKVNGNNYVTGIAGRRYSIVVKNHSQGRIEVVASVDGLDVIDGKSASFKKRGYLVDPYGELEIEGFRTSTSEVAAFRFGSVEESYAEQKHGDSRNVGVIGIALFHEKGDSPSAWGTPNTHEDVTTRHDADPFPQQYATPP